jgi:hypothetical protein
MDVDYKDSGKFVVVPWSSITLGSTMNVSEVKHALRAIRPSQKSRNKRRVGKKGTYKIDSLWVG